MATTTKTKTKMKLMSPSFTHGGLINAAHTCDGANLSPELRWTAVPDDARSFALIVDDPDAPSGKFTHWVLFDIPATVHELAEGATGVGVAGRNDFQGIGYGGPCPPPKHGEHRYFFKLYALDVAALGLSEGVPRQDLEAPMEPHVLEHAELMGRYGRP
jgi:Raf kinase inhibitor-like YbhB/YbcL family protein